MHEPKSADVLARMDPVKAKQVTTELARRSKLLDATVPAPRAPHRPRTVVNQSLTIGA
jgi:hypothetical protein